MDFTWKLKMGKNHGSRSQYSQLRSKALRILYECRYLNTGLWVIYIYIYPKRQVVDEQEYKKGVKMLNRPGLDFTCHSSARQVPMFC